jgi:adenylate cyclase
MHGLAPSEIFQFEDFRLDRRGGGLFWCDGTGTFEPVAIGSRALDILGVMLERAGEVVSKDEIIAAVWPGTVVEDSNLTVQVSTLRRLLDRGRSNGSCIQTIPGRGYRFVAAVRHPAAGTQSSAVNGEAARAEDGEPKLVANLPASDIPIAAPSRRSTAGIAIVAAAGAALAVAVSAWWLWPATKSPPTPAMAAATSIPQLLAAPRLSIVVLPFANLSNDPDQQYFADGITDDLTTDLSRIAHSFVISRNSAFTYRDKPVNAKQIGRDLGVRYVLEGSVRRSGNQVRVNAQLIDANTDAHLWADQFDGDMGDLFALQNEITSRIAITLDVELVTAEATRPNDHPDALNYIFQGRAALSKPRSRENLAEAISLFEHALVLDPHSAEARSWLAVALADRVLDEMTDSRAADIERAKGLIAQALAASPNNPLEHFANGLVLRAQDRCEEAIPEFETVLVFDRNWVSAAAHIGRCRIFIGPIEDAIPAQEQAIRLSPLDPQLVFWYFRIGQVHLLQSRIDEAIAWLDKARHANPRLAIVHRWFASAYALKGDLRRATAEVAEARRLDVDGSSSSIARLKAGVARSIENPAIRGRFEDTYFAGLRKAGMPEE